MRLEQKKYLTAALLLLVAAATRVEQMIAPSDLDAFWSEFSRTVAEGDFDAYAAAYHRDAVFVKRNYREKLSSCYNTGRMETGIY